MNKEIQPYYVSHRYNQTFNKAFVIVKIQENVTQHTLLSVVAPMYMENDFYRIRKYIKKICEHH